MRDPVRSFIIAPFQPDLALLGADLATRPQTLVIVPRAALGRELRRAANAARIVTWLDLARDLAPAAAAARGFLGEDAAAWIVRGLRPASQRARTIFDGVLSERGFRAELLRAFLDLAAAGLASAVEAERFLVQQAMDLPRPVRHVLELYVQWRRGFEATHDDRAARLRAAAAAARAGGAPAALQARHVVFFGRPELDAMEMDLVAALALDAELDLVFLAPPAPGDTEHLPAWFASRGFTIENRAPAKPRAVIAGISAPSPELEGVEVARRILAAVDEGILFAEMAVVARTPVRLEPVARALERAGVPHGRAAGAPVAATRAGRALSALLELIESGEPLDAALLFLEVAPLAPGALGLDEEAMPAAWERVAREARLGRAPSAWDTRLARFATQQEQRAERQRRRPPLPCALPGSPCALNSPPCRAASRGPITSRHSEVSSNDSSHPEANATR
jgi:hypothetical protein